MRSSSTIKYGLFAVIGVVIASLACTSNVTLVATPTPEPTASLRPSVTSVPPSTMVYRELNMASPGVVPHWDIHLTPSPILAAWGPGIVYSRLLRFRSGSSVPVPNTATECDLCASWEQVDSTTYIFRLRNDVRWQDIPPVSGRRLIAEDVVFSYRRQGNPSYPNAPLLENLKSIEAQDEETLIIVLETPSADFLTGLASGFSKIVAPEAVMINGHLQDGPIIGSGPWLWDDTRDHMRYFFNANPDYYEYGLPYVDRLNIHVIEDQQTRRVAFLLKKLDIIEYPTEKVSDIKKTHPEIKFLLYREAGTGLELALKVNAAPMDDLNVRKAIFSAIDPWDAIDTVWHGFGFVSLGMPVYNPDWIMLEEELKEYLGDPDRARVLLADSGQDLPIPLALTVADYGDAHLEYGAFLSKQLESAGFRVTLSTTNPINYVRDIWYGGGYSAFVGPIAPMTTPNMYLFSVLHSRGQWNTHAYNNSSLDMLIEAQATMSDPFQRRDLVLEVQRHMMDQAVRFMPMTTVSTWAWWPRVRGFNPNFTSSEYFHLARLKVELLTWTE